MRFNLPPWISDKPLATNDPQDHSSIRDYKFNGNHQMKRGAPTCNISIVREMTPSACPATIMLGLHSSTTNTMTEASGNSSNTPLVHDPNIHTSSCQTMGAHQACRPSTNYQDINFGFQRPRHHIIKLVSKSRQRRGRVDQDYHAKPSVYVSMLCSKGM